MKKYLTLLILFFITFSVNVQENLPFFSMSGNFIVPKQLSLKISKGDSISYPFYKGGNALLFKNLLENNACPVLKVQKRCGMFNRTICYLKTNNQKAACEEWERLVKPGDEDAPSLILKNCI